MGSIHIASAARAWKHVLVALCLAILLGSTLHVSLAQGQSSSPNVVVSLTGAGLARFDAANALPFNISARLRADGSAEGRARFDFFAFSPRVATTMDINCIRVAHDGVILSGVIVRSENPGSVGKVAIFGVIDDPSGDRISSVFTDLPPGADCKTAGLAVLLPVVHGTLEVRLR